MRRQASAAAPILALALGACATVGPEYQPAELELPAAYHAPVPALFRNAAAVERWWHLLGDEQLNRLVARGLDENLELQTAASRVREARALARATAARGGLSVNAGGAASADWISERRGFTERGTTRSAEAFLDAVWTIDLYGGLERSRQAAFAEAGRQEALRREVARVTSAEIAATYVDLRAAERRLELTRQSLELQRKTLALVRARVEAGLAPGLDQVRAQAAVAALEADIGPLRSEISRLANALAVLLGAPPGAFAGLIEDDVPIPSVRAGGALGVPLDLLRRRPDVQAAELLIVARTAEVGVALAELYPQLTLPGVISAGYVNAPGQSALSFVLASLAALIDVPLYDGGERRANVEAAEERVTQAALIYRETVLRALEDVEAALLAYEGSRRQRDALIDVVANNRLAYEQSQELYRQGFVTFLDVLDSQRQWNTSLQQLALAERDVSVAVVALYSGLGGEPE